MKKIKFKHWVYITKIKRQNEYYQRMDRIWLQIKKGSLKSYE